MRDIDYLKLLSKNFKNREETSLEISNLNAILNLPKGTEYFFSDLHGEHESFIHLLRSASGIIRQKIKLIFKDEMSDEEILELANIIYFPEEKLHVLSLADKLTTDYQVDIILKLLVIVKVLSEKYTRSKVRKTMDEKYVYIMEELLYKELDVNNPKKTKFYEEIINTIIDIGFGKSFITALCNLIQRLAVDSLHIVGDIFDRGPRHDLIIDELMRTHDVDIEWGNHDVEWLGAYFGNETLIINALRIAVRYNCFDMLEDGYGINLRGLSEFADRLYFNDDCKNFMPNILDENKYDYVSPITAARMQKALEIIQLKLENNLFKKHPEYGMQDRILLERINFKNWTINIDGKEYQLNDKSFPTIDPDNPTKLTVHEQELVKSLKKSFMRSKRLGEHIKYIFENGSLYKVYNNNLLFHGIIPFDDDGEFYKLKGFYDDNIYSGKSLLDYFENLVRCAYKDYVEGIEDSKYIDLMYYLWAGRYSPLFGKDVIRTFELYFVDDKEIRKEHSNPYYKFVDTEETAIKILKEFKLGKGSHIINGHVPVKTMQGENPVKANGRVFIIDGGLSKSYQKKTGIAGYTLIYDSKRINLATHQAYKKGQFNTPIIETVEELDKGQAILVRDTDTGKEIKRQIQDLRDLLEAFEQGIIKENHTN